MANLNRLGSDTGAQHRLYAPQTLLGKSRQTSIGPFHPKAATRAWCDNDAENGGIAGFVIDSSCAITENQRRHEQQVTGQHWIVDTAGD